MLSFRFDDSEPLDTIFQAEDQSGGYGFIIRNELGRSLWAQATFARGSDASHLEVIALWEGLISLLKAFVDRSYNDMPGLDPSIAVHRIPLLPDAKPVKQKPRRMKPDYEMVNLRIYFSTYSCI